MKKYTNEELTEALRAINSIIHKCEKAQEKFAEGISQHTLLKNRLQAMYISKALIKEALISLESATDPQIISNEKYNPEQLLLDLDRLHTTELGVERIRKHLGLHIDDVVGWCQETIKSPNASIIRKGKNWYITVNGCKITINAHSYTIITAHTQT